MQFLRLSIYNIPVSCVKENFPITSKSRTFYFQPDNVLPTNFSQKLRSYLKILKNSLPNNMEIGLSLPVFYFRDSVNCCKYIKISMIYKFCAIS